MVRKSKQDENARIRVAGYVRVSSLRQAAEGDSLAAQQHEIEQEVEFRKRREGWEPESVEFYVDAGRSAKDQNRPQLQRLKRDIASGSIDVVICFKLDRITRSLKDFIDLWALFDEHDVDVVSLREKFDTSMPTGEAMVQLIMVFAQLERKMTAERTVSIMKDRAERGLWNGGHVLGYRSSDDESGKLVVKPDEAVLVRTIFDKFEELGSAGAVARHLSDLGIRYPTYKTRNDKPRGGNLFQKQKITRILRAPVYIGRICWGETEVDDCHPPIIERQQFERVQTILDETTVKRANQRKPKGRHYLLTGLIRCSCGAHMVGFSAHGRNRKHFYYSCTKQNHEGGKYSCQATRIPAEPLEEAVIERIAEIGREVEAREKIVDRALQMLAGASEQLKQEEELLQRQRQKTRGDITKLLEVLKTLGAKGLASVESELRRLEREDKQLDVRIKELRSGQEPMNRLSRDARSFLASWEDVGDVLDAATDEERGIILRHYIDVLELKPDDAKGKTGTYRLKLFPEVRPDRGFGEESAVPEPSPPDLPTKNGDDTPVGSVPGSLTDAGSVCITDRKAPRQGLEP